MVDHDPALPCPTDTVPVMGQDVGATQGERESVKCPLLNG